MSTTKHRSTAGKSIAVFFIVFMILEALVIFGVSTVFKNKDVTPSIAGYSMFIMDSNKMGDAVPEGALVIAANGAPSVEGVKKAVLAEEVPGIGTSIFWLADVSTSADLNGVLYTVFQDKNPTKLYQLKTQNIVGTASSYYVTAGKIIRFVTSRFGQIVMIGVPLFLLVLLELIIMIVNRVRFGGDSDDDDDEGEDDDEEPVRLDDFLFGGENDKTLIEQSVHHDAETNEAPERAAHQKAVKKAEPVIEKAPEPVKAVKEEKKETAPSKPADIDPSYYEKAAKLIDGNTSAEGELSAEKPDEDIKFEKKSKAQKTASASLEDLMKLMEQESDKLKNQLNK